MTETGKTNDARQAVVPLRLVIFAIVGGVVIYGIVLALYWAISLLTASY